MSPISLLRKMVSTPSVTGEEDAVATLVLQQLEDWGIAAQRFLNNIVARSAVFDDGKPTLLLCAHLDTVPPAEGYTRDCYAPGTEDDRVWGLGSNDDGGSVVALVETFRQLQHDKTLNVNLLLALTCEEERSGPHGARYLWEQVFGQMFPRPDFAIIGEPTGCRAATSERGLLVIDAEAKGVSGHAARNEGTNALYHAMEDIATLRNFRFERVSPLMGKVGLNVTQIASGTAHNVIPDSCKYVIDIRPTECYTNAEILAILQDALERPERGELQTVLTPRNLRNRSSATHAGSPLLAALAANGIPTFSSPTTSDWMVTPCDAVKMGPGESSRSHHPDEFILVSEIEGAIALYTAFIRTLGTEL